MRAYASRIRFASGQNSGVQLCKLSNLLLQMPLLAIFEFRDFRHFAVRFAPAQDIHSQMPALDDMQLLGEYATRGSEMAFTTLVSRHLNMVYSVALRHAANPHHAEEITQAVFIMLARKAGKLRPGTILAGWLFHTARWTAANFVRDQSRRRRHEQEAVMQSIIQESGTEAWRQMAPLLDEAIADLSADDRNAIVLRYMEGKHYKIVSAELGLNEDGVRMRVNRAVEKLRKFFARRGVSLSAVLIVGALSAHVVQAAPAGLGPSVVAVSVAKTTPAAASTAALIKSTLNGMAWAKLQSTVLVGAGIALVAGTATVAVTQFQPHASNTALQTQQTTTEPVKPAPTLPPRDSFSRKVQTALNQSGSRSSSFGNAGGVDESQIDWSFDSRVLAQQPPVVIVRPSKEEHPGGRGSGSVSADDLTMSVGTTMKDILRYAYNVTPEMEHRVIMPTNAPDGLFDFMVTLPEGGREALQQVLKEQYGLTAKRETREVEALQLTIKNTNAPGLRVNSGGQFVGGGSGGPLGMSVKNFPMANLAAGLERMLGVPVIDQTGATNRFDYEFSVAQRASFEEIKQAALDRLGLELTPAPVKQRLEFLVVEKREITP